MLETGDDKYRNVFGNRQIEEKNVTPKKFVKDEELRICAPIDKKNEFLSLVAWMAENPAEDKPTKKTSKPKKAAPKEDDSEVADDEDEDDVEYIEGYDKAELAKLKSKLEEREENTYRNIKTHKPIKDNATNRKKFEFLEEEGVAVEKLDDEKKMKKYLASIRKMLE